MNRLPIEPPSKVIAVGLNYRDHAAESSTPPPATPILFTKWPSCLIPSGEDFDTFGPIGPRLVPAPEIADPQALAISCRVNGQVMQDSNTDQMIFSVADLIAHISSGMTLQAGDVITTGTPPGVGAFRATPVFLNHGDTVEVEIEGIGRLVNNVRCGA